MASLPTSIASRGFATGSVLVSRIADQRADLDRQVASLVTWAADQTLAVGKVAAEVGSC